jgi:hypothetical protein
MQASNEQNANVDSREPQAFTLGSGIGRLTRESK